MSIINHSRDQRQPSHPTVQLEYCALGESGLTKKGYVELLEIIKSPGTVVWVAHLRLTAGSAYYAEVNDSKEGQQAFKGLKDGWPDNPPGISFELVALKAGQIPWFYIGDEIARFRDVSFEDPTILSSGHLCTPV